MLLINTLVYKDALERMKVIELLLKGGVPLETVWEDSGETALHMAVVMNDAQVIFEAFKRLNLSRSGVNHLG
jgi:hypothetical protein